MAERVGEQVQEDALDLTGAPPARGAPARRRASPRRTWRASARRRRRRARSPRPARSRRHLPQLERERAGVDPGQLEEVVDELAQVADLVVHAGQVLVGRREAVLERLDHRLQGGEGRAQVVARVGDELAPGVEEPLELARHLVEGGPQLGELGGPVLRRARAQVAGGEPLAAPRWTRATGAIAGARDQQRPGEGGDPRPDRGGEDGQVVPGREHQRAGQQHRAEREHHGDERERAELQAQARQAARQRARARRRRRASRRATARAGAITRRTGSRRPRPSGCRSGCEGSRSIFSRSRRTWTVTVPVSAAGS